MGKILERLSDASGMPKDVMQGAPLLTMTGQTELRIENYRGIREYTDSLILVQTKTGRIAVAGKELKIEYYTNEEMKITGMICSVEYLD